MDFVLKMKTLAKSNVKKIVLPEGDEERTLKAAEIIHAEKIAELILLEAKMS